MAREQNWTRNFVINLGATAAPSTIVLVLIVVLSQSAQAQTFKVIYNFTRGQDGYSPSSLAIDKRGNLYGTTLAGGSYTEGAVFKLTRSGSSWLFSNLYSFQAGNDGALPMARPVIGPNGSLYGTTELGGTGPCYSGMYRVGCGTVFNLQPPLRAPISVFASWVKTTLYSFPGDYGQWPTTDVTVDPAGNVYGTMTTGGGLGNVYELMPSGGGWLWSRLYSFPGGQNGSTPESGVTLDPAGNVYGTTLSGGNSGCGTVYEISPSGPGRTYQVLHSFSGSDGSDPIGDLIRDTAGNLYGTTVGGCDGYDGTVFELSPSGAGWTFTVLYQFTEPYQGSAATLAMDPAGNLYGTTTVGSGNDPYGSVFKLAPSGNGWTYTTLYTFTGKSDGGGPTSVVLDSMGNIFGTAGSGGASGNGVVFEITP